VLSAWCQATSTLANVLSTDVLFPVVDIWRLAFLDQTTAGWVAAPSTTPPGGPLGVVLPKAIEAMQSRSSSKGARNFNLTVLRMLCNSFSSAILARRMLTDGVVKPMLTTIIVSSLLHDDGSVRTAAASLAFNVGAWLQSNRVEAVKSGKGIRGDADGEDEEWEVELVSAILEAFGRETANEEVGELIL
jgi:hypothetical protein